VSHVGSIDPKSEVHLSEVSARLGDEQLSQVLWAIMRHRRPGRQPKDLGGWSCLMRRLNRVASVITLWGIATGGEPAYPVSDRMRQRVSEAAITYLVKYQITIR